MSPMQFLSEEHTQKQQEKNNFTDFVCADLFVKALDLLPSVKVSDIFLSVFVCVDPIMPFTPVTESSFWPEELIIISCLWCYFGL